MVYLSSKDNVCNNQRHHHFQKIIQNDEEGSEIEFEGWVQLGNPVGETERNFKGRCGKDCYTRSSNRNSCQMDNNCCVGHQAGQTSGGGGCRSSCNHSCGSTLQPSPSMMRVSRCVNCRGRNTLHGNQAGNESQIFYVNNRQNAPTVVVQKPQTVVVRNKSRPPIVVQQPPPNVIVKNDPPQPIYVQNCPPNVTVKNSEAGAVRQLPGFLNNYDRFNNDYSFTRQSTSGIPKNINSCSDNRRNQCIYNCKRPCYINL